MSTKIVTRFAPSPTGYLHIGGARTALFNWLYARGAKAGPGSQFLLRIEDTDRARHNEAAVAAITDGLRWLGLDWDGEAVSQFARADRHAEVARSLLATGAAYRCWLAGEALEAAREAARAQNERFVSPWRDATSGFPDGPFSIRLKAPTTGETVLQDEVQGEVRFPNAALDDMVLLRSDGTPTYMLAVVVDDQDMGVTHVVRGDDHLINGGRQKQLIEALGWPVPTYAHLPLIHGMDGKKLSKRHGAVGVEAYRDAGFLPEGVRAALLRLGWSHGDAEVISTADALAWFDLGGINRAAARLDPDRFAAINAHFVSLMTDTDFLAAATPFLPAPPAPAVAARLERAAPQLKARCRTLAEIADVAGYLLALAPYQRTPAAEKTLATPEAAGIVAAAAAALEQLDDFSAEGIDAALKGVAASLGVGFGKIGPSIRAAIALGLPAPGLGEAMFALGRDETLARLQA